MEREEIIKRKLAELQKSKFRSGFSLKEKDITYIEEKGLEKIREHAKIFIKDRLSSYPIANDGRQTPMKGHPVFIAQHATATCCRGCLYKWHGIDMNRTLKTNEINYIVSLIMAWINRQMEEGKK